MGDEHLKTPENTRIVHFEDMYDTFENFYSTNRTKIYGEVIKIFEELVESEEDVLFLDFHVDFTNLVFNSSISYRMEKLPKLTKTFLSHFEELEDYEMCGRIKKLIDKTKNPS